MRNLRAVLDKQSAPGQPALIASGLPARIESGATYSVVASELLAAGGEGFSAMTRGTDRRPAGKDVDALAAYAASGAGALLPR
jgi:hypothetical protein